MTIFKGTKQEISALGAFVKLIRERMSLLSAEELKTLSRLVNGSSVERRDQVRIENEVQLVIKAQKKSDLVLIDVPGE